MKITAVTQDQIIIIDEVVADMRTLGGYHMTDGEWALHFDTITGYGEIEFIDNRQNQVIGQAYFEAHYTWLIDEHTRYMDSLAAQV
jgi:hypothetical protein